MESTCLGEFVVFGAWGVESTFSNIFGEDTPLEPLELRQIAARALLVYVAGVMLARFGKSRMLTRATTLDVLIGIILGSILSRGITGTAPLSSTMVASTAVVIAHWGFTALTWRWHWLGKILKGNSKLIVKEGKLLGNAMRSSHISRHDLLTQMRIQGIDDIDKIERAYKERNGEISFICKPTEPKIVEVAVAPGVQTVRISLEQR